LGILYTDFNIVSVFWDLMLCSYQHWKQQVLKKLW